MSVHKKGNEDDKDRIEELFNQILGGAEFWGGAGYFDVPTSTDNLSHAEVLYLFEVTTDLLSYREDTQPNTFEDFYQQLKSLYLRERPHQEGSVS